MTEIRTTLGLDPASGKSVAWAVVTQAGTSGPLVLESYGVIRPPAQRPWNNWRGLARAVGTTVFPAVSGSVVEVPQIDSRTQGQKMATTCIDMACVAGAAIGKLSEHGPVLLVRPGELSTQSKQVKLNHLLARLGVKAKLPASCVPGRRSPVWDLLDYGKIKPSEACDVLDAAWIASQFPKHQMALAPGGHDLDLNSIDRINVHL